jgi:hypothetical protein
MCKPMLHSIVLVFHDGSFWLMQKKLLEMMASTFMLGKV